MVNIFISHIDEEAKIAFVLKGWIESSFLGQCKVFVSSDKEDIPPGSKWLDEINAALESASVFIVLCSPKSLSRPWINFETGCGWIKNVPIIPICHSGQQKSSLPAPISMFQAVEVEEPEFANCLLSGIARSFGFDSLPRIDRLAMQRELLEACDQSSKLKTTEDQKVSSSDTNLPSEGINILKFLAQHSEDGSTTEELASHLGVSDQKMKYFLDLLKNAKLLSRSLYFGSPTIYSLNQAGRKYLFDRGML